MIHHGKTRRTIGCYGVARLPVSSSGTVYRGVSFLSLIYHTFPSVAAALHYCLPPCHSIFPLNCPLSSSQPYPLPSPQKQPLHGSQIAEILINRHIPTNQPSLPRCPATRINTHTQCPRRIPPRRIGTKTSNLSTKQRPCGRGIRR